MNKSESKYFNTAVLMDKALLKLLEKKDFGYITVKEICNEAGVNRSTFYLHYETIADLLAEAIEYNNKCFLEMFSEPKAYVADIENIPVQELLYIKGDYLTPYLTYVRENKYLYRAVYKNPDALQVDRQFENLSKFVLAPIMKRFNISEGDQPYRINFYIHGCMGIIREWLNRNCKDPIEDIERNIIACILPKTNECHPFIKNDITRRT